MMRNTKPGFFCFILFSLFSLHQLDAQRNKNLSEENRFIDHFDQIAVSAGIDLYLTQGNDHKLKVVANDAMMDDVITELEGDKLIVKMKNKSQWNWRNWKNNDPIEVHLTFETLKSIKASGGSDIYSQNQLRFEEFEIIASGGSDVKLDLDLEQLYCQTSGGSDLYLSGRVNAMEAYTSGGSDLHAKEFKIGNCILESSGGSDAKVTVNGELEVRASGASDVFIYGNPKIMSKRSSGASDIHIRS